MKGTWLAIGGTVLAVAVGVTVLERRRRRARTVAGASLAGELGRGRPAPLIERRRVGDMTLSIYSDSQMPIDMRVGIIQDLVRDSLQRQQVRPLAQAIVGHGRRTVRVGKYDVTVAGAACQPHDAYCKADAIGRWTATNIRYSGDIAPVKKGRHGPVEPIDFFQSAMRTVEIGAGDCDDSDGLEVTLLEEVGVPAHHRVTAPRALSDWGHIYTMANVGNGKLVALDATLPGYKTGREAPHSRKIDFPAVGG